MDSLHNVIEDCPLLLAREMGICYMAPCLS